MARPSKLTDKQWAEIEKRLLEGGKPASLAKEFGIDRAAITRKFSQHVKNVKHVANQIVATESALKALPVAQQMQAISLADEMRAMMSHIGGAGKFGAMTAHRLSMIANVQAEKIDEAADFEENAEALKSVMALSRTANEASTIAMNILKVNQSAVNELNNPDEEPEPRTFTYNVIDGRVDAYTDPPAG